MTDTPWWAPKRHEDRRPFLLARNKIKSALRNWFAAEDFIEVECGALQISPGNETHLHAFSSKFLDEDGSPNTELFLHTSPEFSCKKLLAAGETKIVDFARVYRNRESGPLHAPEFTMVEWYRTGASLQDIMQDTVNLVKVAALATAANQLEWKNHISDPSATPEYLTVTDAFKRYADIDLDAVLDDTKAFRSAAARSGVSVSEDTEWTDIFSAILVTKIEHNLGMNQLTFLYRYPICEAALARPCADDPRFAERFELYGCGVELANGFGELTDPIDQRKRFEDDMNLKLALYGENYPIDEDFLDALGHMPDASGVALGFDRIVMLCSGARRINDVLWTPFLSQ